MKVLFIIVGILTQIDTFSQSQVSVDSLSSEICHSIANDKSMDDSARITNSFYSHTGRYIVNIPENKREDFLTRVFLRLQITCELFAKILEGKSPKNESWRTVSEIPASKLSSIECSDFFRIKHYRYVEPSGDTTRLTIVNGYWIDTMKDGTYSKLKLEKKTDSDFELSFEKSNNEIKSKLSRPGDKYFYRLVERTQGYYVLCVGVLAINSYALINVYY